MVRNLVLSTQEFAAQMFISAKMMNEQVDLARAQLIKRELTASVVDFLVVDGKKVTEAHINVDDSDVDYRGATEINFWAEGIDDLTLLALTAKQAKDNERLWQAIMDVDRVPWWRFLWLKARGRPLVETK